MFSLQNYSLNTVIAEVLFSTLKPGAELDLTRIIHHESVQNIPQYWRKGEKNLCSSGKLLTNEKRKTPYVKNELERATVAVSNF